MAVSKKVILDAGHGGGDPGAVYAGRQEKDDNLKLVLAVGKLLAEKGVDVMFTRIDDTYQTPYEKAEIGNRSGAGYFVSFHRNAMPQPGSASGAQVLIYGKGTPAETMADNILTALTSAGFDDQGVIERPGLIVLNQTHMPSVLIETGFLDNEADNRLFDENFDAIARAVADAVYGTLKQESGRPVYYQVQVGAYTDRATAEQVYNQLTAQGFPAYVVYRDGYYKVRAGAFLDVDNAAQMEKRLREYGYNTYMVREEAVD